MVIVPMSEYYRTHGLGRVNADRSQVSKRRSDSSRAISAAVNNHPVAETEVQNKALAHTRAEYRDLELVARRRV